MIKPPNNCFKRCFIFYKITDNENFIRDPKMWNNYGLIQLYHNIGLFFIAIAICTVIALDLLCFIFGIISVVLCANSLSLVTASLEKEKKIKFWTKFEFFWQI